MLLVFSGIPGTGKSTLAHEVARRLGAVYLRLDRRPDTVTELSNKSLRHLKDL